MARLWTPSRRHFLQGAAATAGLVAGAPYLITSAKAAGPVVVMTYGGSWTAAEAEAFYKPFTKATGIEVKTSTPVSYAKLKAQVDSGNYEWDLSTIPPPELKRANDEGLVEPLDWNIIDKGKINVPIYNNGLGSISLGTLLMYRTDKFPNGGPQTWADFWNIDKFPGKRALYDRAFTAVAFALAADGVPVDKIYPMDIDRGFKSLDRIKKHVRVWWKQGNQSQQLIQDGEADMIAMWSARGLESIEKNKCPAALSWQGAEINNSYWFVSKGTPRKKESMQFLEVAVQAENQAKLSQLLAYGPLNPDAFKYLSEAEAKRMPTYPANRKVAFEADSEWLGPRLAPLNERWAQWLAA